jgi:hypothetical protein
MVRVRHIFLVGLFALGLVGCDARRDLWSRVTNDIRVFMTAVSCLPNRAGGHDLLNQKFYQASDFRWWINDPCRGSICNPVTVPPVSPDRFAYAATVVNEAGSSAQQKVWVVERQDILPLTVGMTSRYKPPSWFNPPSPARGGEVCVGLVTVPWQASPNRPFWVADGTLSLNPADLQTASMWTALTLGGLIAAFAVATGFIGAGFFDAPRGRGSAIARAIILAVIAASILMYMRSYITEPAERLPKIQTYYSFYNKLPKSGGNVLPMSPQDARTLFAGPPLTIGLEQSTSAFNWVALISLLVFLALFIKRIIMGLYWVLVPLPLEVRFRRARARGDWPRASEIVDAVRQGTMNKSSWQSRAMEMKAERFKRELDAMAARLRARTEG